MPHLVNTFHKTINIYISNFKTLKVSDARQVTCNRVMAFVANGIASSALRQQWPERQALQLAVPSDAARSENPVNALLPC